ncbi:MAG: helix-turn-helix domain-containing protein [Bacteroidales bacterium]|nr:helix-turn-helix domain-containing protein [Bacteroidales bacterium]
MQKIKNRFVILFLALLGASCSSPPAGREEAAPDSVYSPANIQRLGATDYDSAIQLTDEGMQKGLLSAFTAYQLKSSLTYQYTEDNATAAQWLRKALEQEEAQEAETRTSLLYHLATILDAEKDYTACLATCTEGKELAHSLGHTYQQHSFNFIAGNCLFDMGEDETGLKMMRDAIKGASTVAKSEEEYGHLVFFASSLIYNYLSVKDYSAAIEECAVYEHLLSVMATAYPETPESYLDRSRFYLDIDRAICYAGTGNKAMATQAFQDAQTRAYVNTESGKISQVDYFAVAGDPESILRIYEDVSFTDADTVSRAYRKRLARLSEAYHNAGLHREAAAYDARYNALSEQIKAKEQIEGTFTKAAEYDSQNFRLALSDTTSILRRYHRHFIVAIILFAIAFVAFFILNHLFSKRKEAKFNKQAEALKKSVKSLQKQVSLITERELYNGEIPKEKPTLGQLIEGKKLYLNKDLNRDSATILLGISHADITRMLNDIEPGLSFPDYIKGLRIRHALQLLAANPDIPIAELADRSGFYTVRTLQRSFLSITGKTPSEYAKDLKR